MNPDQTMALSKRKHMIDKVSLFSHQRKQNSYKLSYKNFMEKLKSKEEKLDNINGWRETHPHQIKKMKFHILRLPVLCSEVLF
jgi:hypothetical protein